jgi:hemerythrin superfamily protein
MQRYCEFPIGVREITVTLYATIEPSLKNATQKEKNKVAKAIYIFFLFYTKESGKALKYAKKLQKTLPKNTQNSKVLEVIFAMAKESDIEAAKTPQQKQREYDEYMRNLHKRQEKLQRSIDESQRNIDKWNEIINRLKRL